MSLGERDLGFDRHALLEDTVLVVHGDANAIHERSSAVWTLRGVNSAFGEM